MAVGTILVVGPWAVRNQIYLGSPVLTTTHGGYTLLLANNPVFYTDVVAHGWGTNWEKSSFDRWQSDLQAELLRQLGPNATEVERDRSQSLRAREFIKCVPRQFLDAAWYRTRSLWSPVPQREVASKVSSWLVFAVGWYYTVVLSAFAVGMVVVAVRRQFHLWWALYAMVLTIQLVHVAYWTNARMRAPLVPVISLFAVVPLCRKSNIAPSLQFPPSERQDRSNPSP